MNCAGVADVSCCQSMMRFSQAMSADEVWSSL